jgi:hypothetical protein
MPCGVKISKLGFSPHVGLAYRATSTFVIRAGFGIAIDPYDVAGRGVRTNYPLMIAQNYVGANTYTPVGNWALGIPTIVPPDYGNGTIPVPATVVVHAIPKDINRGYVESRNFTIQKEFAHGFVAQAGYVGTLVIRQFSQVDLNSGQVLGAGDDAVHIGPAGVEVPGDGLVGILQRLHVGIGELQDTHRLIAAADRVAPQADVLDDRDDAGEQARAEHLHEAGIVHVCGALGGVQAEVADDLAFRFHDPANRAFGL